MVGTSHVPTVPIGSCVKICSGRIYPTRKYASYLCIVQRSACGRCGAMWASHPTVSIESLSEDRQPCRNIANLPSISDHRQSGIHAEVAANIQKQVSGVTTATSRNMVSGIGESLSRVAGTVGIIIAAFGLVGILMTVLVFVMMINERKGEFEALKAVGADRKLMSGIVAKEAVMVNLAGGIIGIALSGMILIMFRSLFETLLGAGFVIPGPGVIALMAAAALLAVMVSAAVSSFAAVRRIGGKSL